MTYSSWHFRTPPSSHSRSSWVQYMYANRTDGFGSVDSRECYSVGPWHGINEPPTARCFSGRRLDPVAKSQVTINHPSGGRQHVGIKCRKSLCYVVVGIFSHVARVIRRDSTQNFNSHLTTATLICKHWSRNKKPRSNEKKASTINQFLTLPSPMVRIRMCWVNSQSRDVSIPVP